MNDIGCDIVSIGKMGVQEDLLVVMEQLSVKKGVPYPVDPVTSALLPSRTPIKSSTLA